MVADWQHFRLSVKVVDGRGVVTASDEYEGAVLDQLKAADGRLGIKREDHRRRIVKERTN